jgi:AcrR family transcriptional regulator
VTLQESPTPGELGLRERKKLRTRQEIAEAANRLIRERGIERVTIEQIAAAADVAPRTFFRYFDSKEEAFLADQRAKVETFRAALLARPDTEGPLTAVRAAILDLADIYEVDREDVLCKARLVAESPALHGRSLEMHAELQRTVVEALAARMHVDPATDLRPAVIAAAVSGALQAAFEHWAANGADEDLRTLVTAALDLLDGGLDQFGAATAV